MMPFELLPKAAEEIEEAVDFHNENWPGKGDLLRDTIEDEIERICRMPDIGRAHRRGTRKKVVAGFPYYTAVYIPEADRILVVAVAHASRKPDNWMDRI